MWWGELNLIGRLFVVGSPGQIKDWVFNPGRSLATLVYGGVRMKGQIQIQNYGSFKTIFPNFSA